MHQIHGHSPSLSSFLFPTPSPQLHLRRRIATVLPSCPHPHQQSGFSLLTTINSDTRNKTLLQSQTLLRTNRQFLSHRRSSLSNAMSSPPAMDQLTSGASNRIIPIVKAVRAAIVFVHALVVSLLLARRRRHAQDEGGPAASASDSPARRRKSLWRMEEEDTARRRALAEGLDMSFDEDRITGDGERRCRWGTSLFFGVRCNALFCRSWVPVSGELK